MKKKIFIAFSAVVLFVGVLFAANFDIGGSTSTETLQYPILCGTNCTNSAIDTKDYVGTLSVIQTTGRLSGTTPTNTGGLMTSTGSVAGGTWVSVTNFTAVTDGTNTQAFAIDTRSIRRYLRYHMVLTGTAPTGMVGVVFVGVKQTY